MCAKRHRTPDSSNNSQSLLSKKNKFSKARSNKSKAIKAISQVRIIGGKYKRQSIPFIEADGLRPSPDRLRETVFNWLQFELLESEVLDACAGSGVLGFESLSRGAKHVTFIELQPDQAQLILNSSEKLKLPEGSFQVYSGDAVRVILTLKELKHTSFDLVFIDPPYENQLWIPIIDTLIENNLISAESLIYIEDNRELTETLKLATFDYSLLKNTKIGQIFASLITINI